MPETIKLEKKSDFYFPTPLRCILSGASGSGKSYIIGRILQEQKRLFGKEFSEIKYFYPSYLDESPVDYHEKMSTPIQYERGMPSKNLIFETQSNGLLIIDDQYDSILKDDLMAQFFKVISGKRNLSMIIVSQNYFCPGKHGRDIRNSCNYVGLFRNCGDRTLNLRISDCFGMKKSCLAAEKEFSTTTFPFFFIDQSQRSQVSDYRFYTDIFSPARSVYNSDGMKAYVIDEVYFSKYFKKISESRNFIQAELKYENKKKKLSKSRKVKRIEKVKQQKKFEKQDILTI